MDIRGGKAPCLLAMSRNESKDDQPSPIGLIKAGKNIIQYTRKGVHARNQEWQFIGKVLPMDSIIPYAPFLI